MLWHGEELAGDFEAPVEAQTWQQWLGLHSWIADLVRLGHAPKRGKQERTLRLRHRNGETEEGILADFADLSVRFWPQPRVPGRASR